MLQSRIVQGCAAAAMLALGTSAAQAVTIGNFAGGVAEAGWGKWSSGVVALDSTVYTVTDLDTSGDGGALETNLAGFSDSFAYSFTTAGTVAAFFANDLIVFDLIYRGTPTDNAQGGYSQLFQVILQSNYNSNGLVAHQNNYNNGTPVALNSFDPGGTAKGWGAGTSNTQTVLTVAIDYRTFRDGLGGTSPDYLQMWFSTNDSNRRFKAIDNVRLMQIPEPASLGLLGLGATLVLGRKRR